MQKLKHIRHIAPMDIRPLSLRNWYTISISNFTLLLGFPPRLIYRKFHLSRRNKSVVNYLMVLLTYYIDIGVIILMSLDSIGYMSDVTSLMNTIGYRSSCIITSLLQNICCLATYLCFNAISFSRLANVYSTFDVATKDPKVGHMHIVM